MKLTMYELGKLVRLPALWVFLALCIAFNVILIGTETGGRELFNEISHITSGLGQRVDEAFYDALPEGDVGDILRQITAEMENIYTDYDIGKLSDFYEETVKKSPTAVDLMSRKYKFLEARRAHLAKTGAAMDIYAGSAYNLTHNSFHFLFGTLMRAVLLESGVLGMLSVLQLMGYERQYRTMLMVYSTRTGRGLCRRKIIAGVIAALGLYVILTAITLSVYFALWDYSGVWSASVSSQFNYLTDMLYKRPFFTWADFSVAGYLTAELILGGALTAVFSLFAGLCGVVFRSVYAAALAIMLFLLGSLAAGSFCGSVGLWVIYLLLGFLPVNLWLCVGGWFTELGLSAVIPWQETVSAVLNLALLGVGTWLAIVRFKRKDIF